MFLSKAIDHLASAAKKNADFAEKIERAAEARAKRDAAATVDAIGMVPNSPMNPNAAPDPFALVEYIPAE